MAVRSQPKPRPTQTRIKHELLEQYLAIWGRIILNGVKEKARVAWEQGRPFDVHLVYVDTNAYTGRYDGDLEDVAAGRTAGTVYGSAILGVQALDRLAEWAGEQGMPIHTNAILIEKQRDNFRELLSTLGGAGFGARVRQTVDFASLKPTEIAMVRADWTTLVDELVAYAQAPYTFALYLLDPYGPMAIPLDCVSEIIRRPHHDAIINMPYRDLHKKTGLATKRELTPAQREHREHYDRMFRSQRWQAIVQRMHPAIWEETPGELELREAESAAPAELEEELAQLYRTSLLGVDPSLIVKSIRLLFPAHDLTMYYLYLTTHNADGALKMNKLIWDANLWEYRLRQRLKQARRQQRAGFAGSLFDLDEYIDLSPVERDRPSTETVAEVILSRVEQPTLTRNELHRAMADEPFFADEIGKALTLLKKRGRVYYVGQLTKTSEIRFDLAPAGR